MRAPNGNGQWPGEEVGRVAGHVPERRDAIERRTSDYECQSCGYDLYTIAGQPGMGVQIVKCARRGCGSMDRRLPVERRAAWRRPIRPRGWQRGRFRSARHPWTGYVLAGASILAALAALVGALIGSGVLR